MLARLQLGQTQVWVNDQKFEKFKKFVARDKGPRGGIATKMIVAESEEIAETSASISERAAFDYNGDARRRTHDGHAARSFRYFNRPSVGGHSAEHAQQLAKDA